MVYNKIKQDVIKYRKLASKNANYKSHSNVLVSLLGDLDSRAKDLKVEILPDNETFKILRYWAKQMDKLIEVPNIRSTYRKHALKSKTIYESYLPKLMTEEEIISILKVHKFKNIGLCMKFFKEYHANTYNPALVSKLFQNYKDNYGL